MQITQDQLADLIRNDTRAKTLFDQRAYGDCAVRCCEIAPFVARPLRLSKIGVLDVYRNQRATGHLLLRRLEEIAAHNPDANLMLQFMGPGNPESSYPDFSLPEIRAALTAPRPIGLELTPEQAEPMISAGQQPDTITGSDVEAIAGLENIQWQQ